MAALGLYDTCPGLIIPYLTFSLPLAIYILVAFFREIPWDLEQAAQVDGATPFQAFRKVIVPLAAPGMFTAAILVFIFAWNDFLFAISLTCSTPRAPSRRRSRSSPATRQFTQPTGNIAAAAVVVTIPIIIFVLIFQRRSSPGSPPAPSRAKEQADGRDRARNVTKGSPTGPRPSRTSTSTSPTASS